MLEVHIQLSVYLHNNIIGSLLQKLEKQGFLESIKQAVIESEYDVGMSMV